MANSGLLISNLKNSVLICGFFAAFVAACSDSNPEVNSDVASNVEQNVEAVEAGELEVMAPVVNTPTEGTTTEATTAEPEAVTEEPAPAETPVTTTQFAARYSLTFEADWSAQTHPANFPDDPHFSGLVGAVHNEQVIFWQPGQIASNGLEVVAESGAKTQFLDEINSVVNDGRALTPIDEGGIAESPGQRSIEFEVTADYPLVTVVSMLAPSPDWIVGVHGLSLMQDGGFIDSATIDLELYDAGTDSGVSYGSADADTQPRGTITLVTTDPADTDFIEGLPSVGRFVFTRL